MAARQLQCDAGCRQAFDDAAGFAERLVAAQALRQQQAEAAVAGQVAAAGQHDVAQTGQAGDGFGARAQRQRKAQDFAEAACNQRGLRVFAEAQAVRHADGDGDDIFQRAADFNADHIVGCVGAKVAAVKRRGAVARRLPAARGDGDGGRFAGGDLFGKRRPRQHAQRQAAAEGLFDHLVHKAAALHFNALDGAHQPRMLFADGVFQPLADGAQRRRRHRQQQLFAGGDGLVKVAVSHHRRRQFNAGQVGVVAAGGGDAFHQFAVAPPQADRVAAPGQVQRKRRAPGARANHGYLRHRCRRAAARCGSVRFADFLRFDLQRLLFLAVHRLEVDRPQQQLRKAAL